MHRVWHPVLRQTGRGRREPLALSKAQRILVLRLDQIGDLVLTTPLLRELRRSAPEAHITLLVRPGTQALVEPCPYADRVLAFEPRASGPHARLVRHRRAFGFAMRKLWRQRFDLALIPRFEFDVFGAVPLAYFSGARHRVGYTEHVSDYKAWENRGYDQLLTHALPAHDGAQHEVELNLDVLRLLGGTVEDRRVELWTTPEDEGAAEALLRAASVRDGEPLVSLAFGALDPKRRWPLERFADIGRRLHHAYGARLVILGGPDEKPDGQRLLGLLGPIAVDAVGRTSLRETVALLRRCRLHVGNDTGTLHLAAAAGLSVVEISCHPQGGNPTHPNAPERFHPWGVPHHVLRPRAALPCREYCESTAAHCILGITVDMVEAAVQSLWTVLPDRPGVGVPTTVTERASQP